MAKSGEKVNRSLLLNEEDFGLTGIKEALTTVATQRHAAGDIGYDLFTPIRETPFNVFFDKNDDRAMDNMRMNPNLPAIWKEYYGVRIGDFASKGIRESVSVPNNLSVLKISDMIIEGAEPWSDWKSYSRVENMDAPKVNVPKTRYTNQVGGGNTDSIAIYAEGGAKGTQIIGGKMETIELDCSGTNNSYRGTIRVERNHVKDNNFLAVEQPIKNGGNLFYYLAGKKVIDDLVSATATNTDTKANLDLAAGSVHAPLEAFTKVIREKFKNDQRNTADTMFINPADASDAIQLSTGASGMYPFLDKRILRDDNDSDVINNSGMAAALGLKNVWETPQIASGTVMITKRDVAQVVGIREDLTIENYDLTVGGIYDSDLVMRFDVQEADENGAYKITGF